MDTQWVKMKSWHALRPHDHFFGSTTYCGKTPKEDAEVADKLPTGKSCESCLRVTERIQDDEKVVE